MHIPRHIRAQAHARLADADHEQLERVFEILGMDHEEREPNYEDIEARYPPTDYPLRRGYLLLECDIRLEGRSDKATLRYVYVGEFAVSEETGKFAQLGMVGKLEIMNWPYWERVPTWEATSMSLLSMGMLANIDSLVLAQEAKKSKA